MLFLGIGLGVYAAITYLLGAVMLLNHGPSGPNLSTFLLWLLSPVSVPFVMLVWLAYP